MTPGWQMLYIPHDDTPRIEAALHDALAAQGYQPYDPFPGGTGTPPGLIDLVRCFVAPPVDGWTRILGEPGAAVPALSAALDVPLLYGWIDGGDGGFSVWRDGERDDSADALAAFLRPGCSRPALDEALHGTPPTPREQNQPPALHALVGDALPPEVAQLAQARAVNAGQADRLIQRLSGNLFGKLNRQAGGADGNVQAEARALLAGQADPWAGPGGQRVLALANLLALPAAWRDPAWEVVRDAYQLARLHQRSPRLPLMPGDQETLAAVPDALAYRPVYRGRARG